MSTEPISVIADLRFLQKAEINPCFKESLESAISLLESMRKDGEILDWLEARSWVEVRSIVNGRHMDASGMNDTVAGTNLREAITTAMKKEA